VISLAKANSTAQRGLSPEERLEHLRFFVQEGGYDTLPKVLFDWMQEVESQVANLRGRLNDLPQTFERKVPRW